MPRIPTCAPRVTDTSDAVQTDIRLRSKGAEGRHTHSTQSTVPLHIERPTFARQSAT